MAYEYIIINKIMEINTGKIYDFAVNFDTNNFCGTK